MGICKICEDGQLRCAPSGDPCEDGPYLTAHGVDGPGQRTTRQFTRRLQILTREVGRGREMMVLDAALAPRQDWHSRVRTPEGWDDAGWIGLDFDWKDPENPQDPTVEVHFTYKAGE